MPINDTVVLSNVVDIQDFKIDVQEPFTAQKLPPSTTTSSPTDKVHSVNKGSDSFFNHDKNEHTEPSPSLIPLTVPQDPCSGNTQLYLFQTKCPIKGSFIEIESFEILYDLDSVIDFIDEDSFYDCFSVVSMNPVEEVFRPFKIPLLLVKQTGLLSANCRLNPFKTAPTVVIKTEPEMDPVPRVRLKTPQ